MHFSLFTSFFCSKSSFILSSVSFLFSAIQTLIIYCCSSNFLLRAWAYWDKPTIFFHCHLYYYRFWVKHGMKHLHTLKAWSMEGTITNPFKHCEYSNVTRLLLQTHHSLWYLVLFSDCFRIARLSPDLPVIFNINQEKFMARGIGWIDPNRQSMRRIGSLLTPCISISLSCT